MLVPIINATPDLAGEIARRLGLREGSVTTSSLALDGGDYVIAVWKADGLGHLELTPVADLVEELEGDVLDGETH